MEQTLTFTKMHGLGNDYIFIEARQDLPKTLPELALMLARRHFSVGSDGIIVIGPSTRADAFMRIFNADGSEAEMCGNGLRCVAKYIYDRGWVKAPGLTIETVAGLNRATIISAQGAVSQVEVGLPEPELTPDLIPLTADHPYIDEPLADIEPGLAGLSCTVVNLGNPHCVIFLAEDTTDFPVEKWGPLLELNPVFPQRTNVEFVNVLDQKHLRVRVWERGSGETLACGSGACASVVAGVLTGRTEAQGTVTLPGGTLSVAWHRAQGVSLTGPAEEVFRGEIPFSDLERSS